MKKLCALVLIMFGSAANADEASINPASFTLVDQTPMVVAYSNAKIENDLKSQSEKNLEMRVAEVNERLNSQMEKRFAGMLESSLNN